MSIIDTLYHNAVFYSGISPDDCFKFMGVTKGEIVYCGNEYPKDFKINNKIDLEGVNVYPALTDSHVHLLFSVVSYASNANICTLSEKGVTPCDIEGAKKRITEIAKKTKKGNIIYALGYVAGAMQENRLPTCFELDEWTDGAKIAVVNIDGHSSALSTALMKSLGLLNESSNGVFTGESHEKNMGKVMDAIAKQITPQMLAKGIANFENDAIRHGIARVCAMEGNTGTIKDISTDLMVFLAKKMNIEVRLFTQYKDIERADRLVKHQGVKRIGGCGEWEADGSVGSHSAACSATSADKNGNK